MKFTNLLENGPFKKILIFYDAVTKHPELMLLPYKEQAESLQFTLYEVKMVWGFFHGAFSI